MDWVKLRSYSWKKQTLQNVRRASPIPAVAASAAVGERNAKAKGCQLRLDRLSEPQQKPHARREIGNAITKALPKIQEASGVTQMDCLSEEQSTELNGNEKRSMEVNKSINKMGTAVLKDSLHLSSASKESLRNSETTSGMTLPTGVSHFLLQCLDEESSPCSNTESGDGASTYSSPEIFRDENTLEESSTWAQECLEYRNSTLLETSKAINIDKIPHVPNLSQILETSLRNKDQSIKRLSKLKSHSELTGVSAVVAGKQVCKILPTKEKTPELQSFEASSLPQKQTKKIKDQQPRKMKCRKRVLFSSSSSYVLGSAKSCGITAEILGSAQPDTGMLDSSSVHKVSLGEAFLPSTSVNSKEVIPASLSPESVIHQRLCNPPEICCIVKASPESRPLKILQHSNIQTPQRKRVFPPPGTTEDIIMTSKI